MSRGCVVLVSASSSSQAEFLASGMLKNKLAACVNISAESTSMFKWNGEIQKAKETILTIKTRRELFPSLMQFVKDNHSYEVPEIICLPIEDGDKAYLEWISESTKDEEQK